jgi:hypothetical protein
MWSWRACQAAELHHRENLNQIWSRKGGLEDEANDERDAIGDGSDARKIWEGGQKLKRQILDECCQPRARLIR